MHDERLVPGEVESPTGDRFEVVGRAGPIPLKPAPRIRAETSQDLLVVKQGRIFVCSRRDGDIHPGLVTGEGIYSDDTRYLSELQVRLGGKPLILLASSANLGYRAWVNLTNADLNSGEADGVPQMTLNVRRTRLVCEHVHERFEIRNHGMKPAVTTFHATCAADFADLFEVRGVRKRSSRGHVLVPKRSDDGVTFAYIGEDDLFRETVLTFSPPPDEMDASSQAASVSWKLSLEPGASLAIDMIVEPSLAGARTPVRPFETAETAAQHALREWREQCTQTRAMYPSYQRILESSLRDLFMLMTPFEDRAMPAAGVPWYVAPFGRDALLTSYGMLMLNPEPAREALLFLGSRQAGNDDPLRDAEPGKILHEIRSGELARAGLIPHTPYYGTVDATPLFLGLASAYYEWTGDIETMEALLPSFDRALQWIDEHGDADGDGFVEYKRRSPAGLANQGWKDSEDCIVHRDGSLAEGPIALVEVQGYVYMAKQMIAEVYAALGRDDRARVLVSEADQLKRAFNDAFWMRDEGTFALALDGNKRRVESVTTNPGHCLFCRIVDDDKAPAVAERLMQRDVFSGWGLRTLSSRCPAYNPMSYHNGSVWPHDNAIVAAGLKHYGLWSYTEKIARAMFEAALESEELRLPELFCGFRRRTDVPYVGYPVACRPQAWAAAAPFMLLQSLLGITGKAPQGELVVHEPVLPEWLGRVELRNLRIGDARVTLAFGREGATTTSSLRRREGDVRITIRQ